MTTLEIVLFAVLVTTILIVCVRIRQISDELTEIGVESDYNANRLDTNLARLDERLSSSDRDLRDRANDTDKKIALLNYKPRFKYGDIVKSIVKSNNYKGRVIASYPENGLASNFEKRYMAVGSNANDLTEIIDIDTGEKVIKNLFANNFELVPAESSGLSSQMPSGFELRYSMEIESEGSLGRKIDLHERAKIAILKPGYKIEYNVPSVDLLIAIGKNNVANLSMTKEAWEELKKEGCALSYDAIDPILSDKKS
jgi:hypothetical protein